MKVNRLGWPGRSKPRGCSGTSRARGRRHAQSVGVQSAISRAVLAVASSEYRFVDEWDVAAPRERVFAAISDARTYPVWWKPVYIDVDSDGEAEVGEVSASTSRAACPTTCTRLRRSRALESPHIIEADVDGDLRGHGKWTLTENADGGTHVRFDWQVFADKPLLRLLRRSCDPLSAGTTRGRSPGRARVWSRSRDNRAVTARIEPWGPGNLELLQQLMGDPAMTEHLGGPESPAKIADRQTRYESTAGMFKIIDVETGEGVGSVGFWDREWRGETVHEVGWSVVPAFQGRGLATPRPRWCSRRPARRRPTATCTRSRRQTTHRRTGSARKLGFTLLKVCRFEYPPMSGNWMYCNDWRLDLSLPSPARWRSQSKHVTARSSSGPTAPAAATRARAAGRRSSCRGRGTGRAVRRRAAHDQQPHGVHGRARGPASLPAGSRACIVTDSRLMLDSMTKWINGWKRAAGRPRAATR